MAAILADDIFKCIFMNHMIELLFQFHWNMFPWVQLTISQHCFMKWLGTEWVTSHYLNQWWHSSLTHICSTRGRWVNYEKTQLKIHSNAPRRNWNMKTGSVLPITRFLDYLCHTFPFHSYTEHQFMFWCFVIVYQLVLAWTCIVMILDVTAAFITI